MASRKRPRFRYVQGPRYEVRCRPQYSNWGLYDLVDGHLIVSGSKGLMEQMADAWNENDPHHGLPAPRRGDPAPGEVPRKEWPET